MLPGVKDEALVQVRPGVSQGVATLEHHVIDPLATELPRRRETRRTGTDHDGLVMHSVLTSTHSARSEDSVLKRLQVLNQCPAVLVGTDAPPDVVTGVRRSGARGAEPVAIVSITAQQLALRQPPVNARG